MRSRTFWARVPYLTCVYEFTFMAYQRILALIPAAGVGSRMKANCPKQYLPIAGTETPTVLETCIATLSRVKDITDLVVAVSPEDDQISRLNTHGAQVLASGGATRAKTVTQTLQALQSLSACPLSETLVLVHDAARPLVDPRDVEHLIEVATALARENSLNGAVLGVPVADTVKRIDEAGFITQDLSREGLVRVATPQAFQGDALLQALLCHPDVTDESSAMRAAGGRVAVVSASPSVLKLTRPADRELAAAIYIHQQKDRSMIPEIRTGLGYDSHRLVPDRKLFIGGVEIPHALGLAGHSDADVLLHAATDAVLGAAALGNIGIFFPDTDPQYKGADSRKLFAHAWEAVKRDGWTLVNLDAVLIAEKPKMNPHLPAIRASIAAILETDVSRISVKPKTNEKLGFEGREEGISAMVTVLLAKA